MALGLFIGVVTLLFLFLWHCSLRLLLHKMMNTRAIVGFIPVRIFVKNGKLAKEYESYLGELIN